MKEDNIINWKRSRELIKINTRINKYLINHQFRTMYFDEVLRDLKFLLPNCEVSIKEAPFKITVTYMNMTKYFSYD